MQIRKQTPYLIPIPHVYLARQDAEGIGKVFGTIKVGVGNND